MHFTKSSTKIDKDSILQHQANFFFGAFSDQPELKELLDSVRTNGQFSLGVVPGDRGLRVILQAPSNMEARKIHPYAWQLWVMAKIVWYAEHLHICYKFDPYMPDFTDVIDEAYTTREADNGTDYRFTFSNHKSWVWIKNVSDEELSVLHNQPPRPKTKVDFHKVLELTVV